MGKPRGNQRDSGGRRHRLADDSREEGRRLNKASARALPDSAVPFEDVIRELARQTADAAKDPTHDFLHVERVVATARALAMAEGARLSVVIPAAYLHDVVTVPKDDPRRTQASRLSATRAIEFLRELGYEESLLPDIAHAIEAHSFSAGIEPRTLEAAIVRDADRLDALGAIGVARCFGTSGRLGRAFYAPEDAFCTARAADDALYAVDHFYRKLLTLAEGLHTPAARAEGARRTDFLRAYLDQLAREIAPR